MSAFELNTPYTEGYYREQMPAWMTFAAEWQGRVTPDLTKPFRYVDIGCGRGMTACWVKRRYPHAEVYAIDGDPTHIRLGEEVARTLGVDVQFVLGRFEELEELPPIDLAGMHGVWSWISDEARDGVLDLLLRSLKPGGHFYVSYNALPGRSDWWPIQRLFREITHRLPYAPGADRLAVGMQTLEELSTSGFLADRPQLVAELRRYAENIPTYLMHELFVTHWEPQLLSEVARRLYPAELVFTGSANLVDNIQELAMTDAERQHLARWPDEVMRRTVHDFHRKTPFRRDIFSRGLADLSPVGRREALLGRYYSLERPVEDCSLRMNIGSGELSLDASYTDLLQAMAEGPRTGRELRDALGWGEMATVSALGVLCAIGHAFPGDRHLVDSPLDDLMATRADRVMALSPNGSNFEFSRVDRSIFRAKGSPDVATEALRLLALEGHQLIHAERDLNSAEAQYAEMQDLVAKFRLTVVPAMRRSGWSVDPSDWLNPL